MKSALHLVPKMCGGVHAERDTPSGSPRLQLTAGQSSPHTDFLEEFLAVDCLAKARDYLAVEWRHGFSRSIANLQARQILNDCLSRLVDKIQAESEGA